MATNAMLMVMLLPDEQNKKTFSNSSAFYMIIANSSPNSRSNFF